jgi:hypothetical protein
VFSRRVVRGWMGRNRMAAYSHGLHCRIRFQHHHNRLWKLGAAYARCISVHSIHATLYKSIFLNPYEPPKSTIPVRSSTPLRGVALTVIAYFLLIPVFAVSQPNGMVVVCGVVGIVSSISMLLTSRTRKLGIFALLAYVFRVILELS